jgi:hypothetical protein
VGVHTIHVLDTGNSTLNGTNLENAMAATSSDSGPWLIKLEPGLFQLTTPLQLRAGVDIEGSGETRTFIRMAGGSSPDAGATIYGAADSELRFLTIANTGGDAYAIGLYAQGDSVRLKHVTIHVADGTYTYGIYGIYNTTQITLEHVTIDAAGTSVTSGIVGFLSALFTVMDSHLSANGGTSGNDGIRGNSNTVLMVRNSDVQVDGPPGSVNCGIGAGHGNVDTVFIVEDTSVAVTGGSLAVGYGVTQGRIILSDCRAYVDSSGESRGISLESSGGDIFHTHVVTSGAPGYGVYADHTTGICYPRVVASSIHGSTASIRGDENCTVNVGATQLQGPVDANSGTVTCIGCYNQNFTNAGGFTACP